MDTSYDVAVIGAGPAGMIAAGMAAQSGARVVLLEKNPAPGKKLLITGGGRCNILNAEFDPHALVAKYGKKGKALFSPFSVFGAQATWDFFVAEGLPLKIEAEKRAFPASDDAADVRAVLTRYMTRHGVELRTGIQVTGLQETDNLITKIVHNNGFIEARNVILTTGGMSRPETGSTGDGFTFARALGHTVHDPDPALVPITVRNPWVKDAAGIALRDVKLTIFQGETRHESAIGKALFTHDGMSGPLVLNMSKRIGELLKSGPVSVSLDLFPSLDQGALDQKVMGVFDAAKNKMVKNNIGDLVQPRFGQILLGLAGVDPSVPLHQLRREDRLAFVAVLKDLRLSVTGLLGEDRAVVTGGGVDLRDVDFSTMRSKKIGNLFFAGDILDFDRPSGGFSLQICWSTGYVAGMSAAS